MHMRSCFEWLANHRLFKPSRIPFLVRRGYAKPEYEAKFALGHRALKFVLVLNMPLLAFVIFSLLVLTLTTFAEWVMTHIPETNSIRHEVLRSIAFLHSDESVRLQHSIFAIHYFTLIAVLAWGVASTSRVLDSIVFIPELPTKPFVLFLRSFFIEQAIKAEEPFIPLGKFDRSLPREIQHALGNKELVCKIGSRKLFPDLDGGIVWSHDATWFERFKLLATHAKVVMMVPIVLPSQEGSTDKPGTLKEIEHLAHERLIEKTVFVVPPPTRVLMSLKRRQGLFPSVSALWEQSRQLLRRESLVELPPYPGGHGLLFPDRNGWIFVNAVSGRPWNSWRALRDIILNRRLADTPSRDARRIATRLALIFLPIWYVIAILMAEYGLPYLAEISSDRSLGQAIQQFSHLIGVKNFVVLMWLVALVYPMMVYLRYASLFHLRDHGVFVLKVTTVAVAMLGHIAWVSYAETVSQLILQADAAWRGRLQELRLVLYFATMWLAVWLVARWVFEAFRARTPSWRQDEGAGQP